ncbi:MAG: TIGR03013 family PEP-CTERM/XrtA system glycosyltransferase [Azoarcus sp.]|jgi:sugar transferase (PEP-CTERM system associated)|nr:TIGR03013 family PEP-CTERM/XrtA system glycosyltransferase [Azoarcus sp.]
MLKIFSQYFSRHVLQRIGLDVLLLVMAVIISAMFYVNDIDVPLKGLLPSALIFALTMILVNFAFGLYRSVDEDTPPTAFARFVLSAMFCLPAAYCTMLFLPWQGFDWMGMRLRVLIMVLAVLLLRVLINRSQATTIFSPRVLVIGTGKEAQEVALILRHPEQGRVDVLGFFPISDENESVVESKKIINGTGLSEIVKRYEADTIIVAVRELRGRALPLRELLDCKLAGVRILDLSMFHERVRRQVRLDSLRTSWLIFGEGFQQPLLQVLLKRVFDLALAFCLFIAFFPVMAVAALLVVFNDHGPMFHIQERVGLGGQVFRRFKFRCMRMEAFIDAEQNGFLPAIDVSHMTRIGRVLYRLHIDRLPQLFNVLLGDMSLVGPRPEQPFFVDRLTRETPYYGLRHSVKPGMTGWAKVRYQERGKTIDDAIQKLQYDLYYVKNHTLVLDMLVLLETVHVVLLGKSTR